MTQKNTFNRGQPQAPLPGKSMADPQKLITAASTRSHHIPIILYWSLVAIIAAAILSLQPVYANIWDTFSSMMQDVYGKLLGISTIVAVTAATVALLVRMISRNQRAVDEATTWLKRVTVTWLILNTLGFIIAYLQPLISGGQYAP